MITAQTEISALEAKRGYSLMEEVLKHQPEEVKQKVRWLVEASGIRQDDPLFLILLASRINHVLLEKAPSDLENSFSVGFIRLDGRFENHYQKLDEILGMHLKKEESHYKLLEETSLRISESKINQAIDRILAENNLNKRGRIPARMAAIISTSLACGIALVVGSLGGWGWATSQFTQKDAVYLSRQEQNLLDWARSREGKLAKDLFQWNDDLGDRSCQKKVKDLGVTIQIGAARATSGYCWIWIVPTNRRTFVRVQ